MVEVAVTNQYQWTYRRKDHPSALYRRRDFPYTPANFMAETKVYYFAKRKDYKTVAVPSVVFYASRLFQVRNVRYHDQDTLTTVSGHVPTSHALSKNNN